LKLGFVIPWYGDDIGGGAEAACRSIAKLLHSQGQNVEVLTTTVRDFTSDWSTDFHAPGNYTEGGLLVRRFRVRKRDNQAFDAVNLALMRGQSISADQEQCFFREMINSPDLYAYIKTFGDDYLLFFMPYMFGTTLHGIAARSDRAVLVPCLHDESYARLQEVGEMFRRVRHIIYLSPEEKALAERLYGPECSAGTVAGSPVDCNWRGDAERFRREYQLDKYLLYAGRTDQGKNADLLMEYFSRYLEEERTDLRLVFIGGKSPFVPSAIADRVHCLGYLPIQTKYDCYSGALALCIPSTMESFSIVMMESWIAGRPVIVNSNCAVTTGFCKRSNGGLYVASFEEFREVVHLLDTTGHVADRLGLQGQAFVRENFDPDVVADRYLRIVEDLNAETTHRTLSVNSPYGSR
jgi:glycosyltransferase involved in cell wall biosynthesis